MSAVLAEVDTSAESSVLRLDRETRFAVTPLVGKISSVLTTPSGRSPASITFVLENLFDRLAGLSSSLGPCCSLLERLRPLPTGDLLSSVPVLVPGTRDGEVPREVFFSSFFFAFSGLWDVL